MQSLTLNGAPDASPWVNYSRLARGVTLNWTLGSEPTTWGSSPAAAPPSYASGLRPVVGFLSQQRLTLPRGSSASIQIGAQNATRSGQRVSVTASPLAGSGLSASPARGRILVPPVGRETLPLTVRASRSAPRGLDWVTVSVSTHGAATQTVKLAVQVA